MLAFFAVVGQGAALLQELETPFFYTQPWYQGLFPSLTRSAHMNIQKVLLSPALAKIASWGWFCQVAPEQVRGSCSIVQQVIVYHLQQSLSLCGSQLLGWGHAGSSSWLSRYFLGMGAGLGEPDRKLLSPETPVTSLIAVPAGKHEGEQNKNLCFLMGHN